MAVRSEIVITIKINQINYDITQLLKSVSIAPYEQ